MTNKLLSEVRLCVFIFLNVTFISEFVGHLFFHLTDYLFN